jgi:UDP-N-acetyl-D-galactosamine dehydrogenase
VGGHCIGVDPYYLTYKARKLGYHAQIINAGRFINDSMGGYIAKHTVKKISAAGKNINTARVLIMGTTFKENVSDIRNSKVADIHRELLSFGLEVDVVDPHADPDEVFHEYEFTLLDKLSGKYDAIILAVAHNEYCNLEEDFFVSLSNENAILVDLKGIYRKKIKSLTYWSL